MKHSGKAMQAAGRMLTMSGILLVIVLVAGLAAKLLGSLIFAIAGGLVTLWILFIIFTLYFFRDPEARVPAGANSPNIATYS